MTKLKVYDPTGGGSATILSKENFSREVFVDLNTCTEFGLYLYGPEVPNKPPGYQYGIVLVLVSADLKYNERNNWVYQIAFPTDSAGTFYVRNRINAQSWKQWQTFTNG